MRTILTLTLAALAGACIVTRGEVVDPRVAEASSAAQFGILKGLVGTWKGTAGEGEHALPVEVRYRLTAGGTALEETLHPGTPHEMVTLYHRDGPWLMLTHYCSLGNQPRMRAVHTTPPPSGDHARIDFVYRDATNVLEPGAQHMGSLRHEFLGPGRVRTTWTLFQGGKPDHAAQFELRRVEG